MAVSIIYRTRLPMVAALMLQPQPPVDFLQQTWSVCVQLRSFLVATFEFTFQHRSFIVLPMMKQYSPKLFVASLLALCSSIELHCL